MIDNRLVRKQIYIQELLGLYYDSDKETRFEVDRLVKMSNGSRTNKKISGDIINYFNTFNGESQKYFCEIFGPESIIYKNTRTLNKVRRKVINSNPYVYRQSENGIWDISHEFFQLFRYTELQDKWAIDILKIINKDYCVDDKFDKIRLYNVARVITHVNVFGNDEAIYKYKFLEHFIESFYNAVKISEEELNTIDPNERKHINLVEKYTINQIFLYIIKTIELYKDMNFINTSRNIINKIVFEDTYNHIELREQRFKIFLDNVIKSDEEIIKEMFTEMLWKWQNNITYDDIPEFMKVDTVKKYVNEFSIQNNNDKRLKVEDIFGCEKPTM